MEVSKNIEVKTSFTNRTYQDHTEAVEISPTAFVMPNAPPHVYSCFVVNHTQDAMECTVHYNGRPGEANFDEDINVTILPNDEKFFPRRLFQPDIPDSYCKWVKIITSIKVKKSNGKILEVHYPFDNVHCPIRNWEFHVCTNDDIQSKPPTRPANLLKYEKLDQYER